MVLRSIFSGMDGLPQSRPWENDQSRVAMRPGAGGSRPVQALQHRLPGAAPVHLEEGVRVGAATSSTGLLAKELSPMIVPRAAAARATATSPSGCTACTPVGEMMTGRETGCP